MLRKCLYLVSASILLSGCNYKVRTEVYCDSLPKPQVQESKISCNNRRMVAYNKAKRYYSHEVMKF